MAQGASSGFGSGKPHEWQPRIGRRRVLSASNDALCLFIHGLFGSEVATWGDLPEALRQDAQHDEKLAKWDYAFVGYNWATIPSFLDLADLISATINDARNAQHGFPCHYRRFVLVGYSLGTLGIRQLLCNCQVHPPGMLADLKSVILIGSPLVGSALASSAHQITGRLGFFPILDQLRLASPAIRALQQWTACGHANHAWPTVQNYIGVYDWIAHGGMRSLVNWAGDNPIAHTLLCGHSLDSATAGGKSSLMWSVLKSAF